MGCCTRRILAVGAAAANVRDYVRVRYNIVFFRKENGLLYTSQYRDLALLSRKCLGESQLLCCAARRVHVGAE